MEVKKNQVYRWEDVPVDVKFGYCEITPSRDKRLWWYNFECSLMKGIAIIPAVKITTERFVFVNSNHCGIGVHKLLNGGWPQDPHFSLPLSTFHADNDYAIYEFDRELFENHEQKRIEWESRNVSANRIKLEELHKYILKTK